jgi:polysaccharide export outer membrane protein
VQWPDAEKRAAPAPDTATQPSQGPAVATPAAESASIPAGRPAATAADKGAERDSQSALDYRIGPGDVLQVSVWKEADASIPSVVVRPDGKIGLPLLKDVEVVGLTPHEAETMITRRLEKFIPEADVAVVVKDINSKKVYIVGAVKKEGPIRYAYSMTVMQAISEAGGLSDYAKRKKIYVLRSENGKDYRLPFDYDAVLRGERMELNIPLLPGDTLIVPF